MFSRRECSECVRVRRASGGGGSYMVAPTVPGTILLLSLFG